MSSMATSLQSSGSLNTAEKGLGADQAAAVAGPGRPTPSASGSSQAQVIISDQTYRRLSSGMTARAGPAEDTTPRVTPRTVTAAPPWSPGAPVASSPTGHPPSSPRTTAGRRRSSILGGPGGTASPPLLNDDEPGTSLTRTAGAIDIWALGITIVLGGQYFSWNLALMDCGFNWYLIATTLTALAYLFLSCSIAEMTSALPFAGGGFGFARVTHGTYLGYVVGVSESAEYILYVATSVVVLGEMLTLFTGLPVALEPVWWVLFYAWALAVQTYGGRWFWKLNLYWAVGITVILVVYVAAAPTSMLLRGVDLSASWKDDGGGWRGGVHGFMAGLPIATWFFVGVEGLPMACEDAREPRHAVPRGMVSCVWTLFVLCFATLFATIACGPDIATVSELLLPLNHGFAQLLNIESERGEVLTGLLTLPAAVATAFGFIFAYGRQICAMSRSGLLPRPLSIVQKETGTPYVAFLFGSVSGLAVCFVSWNKPDVVALVFSICITSGFVTYICQLSAFIVLRLHFDGLDRKYKSPFGIVGAAFAMAVYTLGIVSTMLFQANARQTALCIGVYLAVASLYYYTCARHTQCFSTEETAAMFTAYVYKANRIARLRRAKKPKKPGLGSPTIRSMESPRAGGGGGSGRRSSYVTQSSTEPSSPRAPPPALPSNPVLAMLVCLLNKAWQAVVDSASYQVVLEESMTSSGPRIKLHFKKPAAAASVDCKRSVVTPLPDKAAGEAAWDGAASPAKEGAEDELLTEVQDFDSEVNG